MSLTAAVEIRSQILWRLKAATRGGERLGERMRTVRGAGELSAATVSFNVIGILVIKTITTRERHLQDDVSFLSRPVTCCKKQMSRKVITSLDPTCYVRQLCNNALYWCRHKIDSLSGCS